MMKKCPELIYNSSIRAFKEVFVSSLHHSSLIIHHFGIPLKVFVNNTAGVRYRTVCLFRTFDASETARPGTFLELPLRVRLKMVILFFKRTKTGENK